MIEREGWADITFPVVTHPQISAHSSSTLLVVPVPVPSTSRSRIPHPMVPASSPIVFAAIFRLANDLVVSAACPCPLCAVGDVAVLGTGFER